MVLAGGLVAPVVTNGRVCFGGGDGSDEVRTVEYADKVD